MTYRAPLRDIRFQLWESLGFADHYAALEGGGDADAEPVTQALLDAVLDEGARFAGEVLAPLNGSGDRSGCTFEAGVVHAPAGFKAAFDQYAAGGWSAVAGPAEYGGQALPVSVSMLLDELVSGANVAWGMYPGLSRGAAGAVEAHGTAQQKDTYLRPLLAGTWTGTMCLTEPQAGSDVGLLRTRAVPHADGTYRISGTKIFISAGEHDLAANIVHLVLARLPDAPAGTRGISLFIVPKFLPGTDAAPGQRNGVVCAGIERKMGIHGNATCMLNFDSATGFLLGPEHGGMRCMFTMMNMARIVVGIQGLGLMETAWQRAADYAGTRLQMRSLRGPQAPDQVADPIMVHPDIRRMLLTQKALIEGSRGLIYRAGRCEDVVRQGNDPAARAAAQAQIDLLTPVCKGFVTEAAFECVNHAVQVFGGHGYISDNGVEQFVRDCRITLLYEGTTQIQALDLLGRKVAQNGGSTLSALIATAVGFAHDAGADPRLAAWAEATAAVHELWGTLAREVLGKALADPDELGAAAVDFLMFAGYALLAESWLRQAKASLRLLDAGTSDGGSAGADPFLTGKLATARFYFERLLPRTSTLAATIRAGGASLMQIDAECFVSR